MTREQYSKINAVNFSTLKWILQSPAHYRANVDSQDDDDPSRFAVGTLAHAMVLEGKDIAHFYAIKPKGMTFASKDGKAWRDAQTLPIIKEEDVANTRQMAERISRDVEACELIQGCTQREHAIEFEFEGIAMKCLLDMWGETTTGAGLGDYKTTTDCRPEAFAKKVDQLDYDMQLALYAEALRSQGYEDIYPFWIAQENNRPFEVQIYKPTQQLLERGRDKLIYCARLLKHCQETNTWPGYSGGIKLLNTSRWLKPIAWGMQEAA